MNFSGKSTDHDVAFYKLVPELRQAFHSKKIGRPIISKFISTYLENPNRFRRTAFNKFRNELTPAFPLLTSIRLRSVPKNRSEERRVGKESRARWARETQ